MAVIPFVGPTNQGVSAYLDSSRSVNCYPVLATPDSKNVGAMVGTPGTEEWLNLGDRPVRGMRVFAGRLYIVVGAALYSVDADKNVYGPLGTLSTIGDGRVDMTDNGTKVSGIGGDQLLILDGFKGYVYNVVTGVFTTIDNTQPALVGFPDNPTHATFLDGYFVVCSSNSMSFNVSDLYNGLSWNPLATATAAASSDPIQTLVSIHQQLLIIKDSTSEFWYNAGVATSTGSPFLRVGGAVADFGTPAPWSEARGANVLFFLGNLRNGENGEPVGVVELNGTTPSVISTPALNDIIARMTTVSDAFGYCYTDSGHTFYVLTFPSENQTHVFDASTRMWHERSTWKGDPYDVGRHLSTAYSYFLGKHLVGDYRNGRVHRMASTIYDEVGDPLVMFRTAPFLSDKQTLRVVSFRRLQIDLEVGTKTIGVTTTVAQPGAQTDINLDGAQTEPGQDGVVCDTDGVIIIPPRIGLSWSDDGGNTWSNEYWVSMGSEGETRTRAIWRRLGASRARAFRVTISDPVKRVLIGATVDVG